MMKNLKVDILSREMIRPSHSTPDHLKSFKFCFIDQLMPLTYIPVIYFYPIKDGHEIMARLKRSLSQTLTEFYPLAGRIREDNITVDCNDEGITYVEAQANCQMLEFLEHPMTELIEHFVPRKQSVLGKPISQLCLVELQVTVFECGGLAIGACFNHKTMDATSLSCFLHSWAAVTSHRQDHQIPSPDFAAAPSRFPPMDNVPLCSINSLLGNNDECYTIKCVLRRFVFDTRAITSLKAKAKSNLAPNPTSVEVVSAFVWKHAMAAYNKVNSSVSSKQHGKPSSTLALSINLRARSVPPMPKNTMGSIISSRFIQCSDSTEGDQEEELHELVGKLHEEIMKANSEYGNSLQNEGVLRDFSKLSECAGRKRGNFFICTSWCKLGVSEVDFGWGKPTWVCLCGNAPTPDQRNVFILIEINGGKGIEAWLTLDEQEMAILEHNQEFLEFAIPVMGVFQSTSSPT